MWRRCAEGPNGVPCGRARSRAETTGTNGLNFVFCNTSTPSCRAVFTGTYAPAIYFVVIFLSLTHLHPFERDVHIHASAHTYTYIRMRTRTWCAILSHSTFHRRFPLAILVTPLTTGRVFAPADFCPLRDVITQQSGLFRAYSSADR